MKLEAEEDAASGRVRVTVLNEKTGAYENNVHVKVIGSADKKFVSGDTDLRGTFIADGVRGTATVIAKKGEEYAFHRGRTALLPAIEGKRKDLPKAMKEKGFRDQAMENLLVTNRGNLKANADLYQNKIQQNRQFGVEVQQTQR